MFGLKLKLSKDLFERAKLAAEKIGASSVDEFVEKIVEFEVNKILSEPKNKQISKEEVDEIAEKLKGLGYIE